MSEELKAAQARIAGLEGEIAKRDARIMGLESQYQRDVWGLNNEGDPIGGDPAGGYANDNARLRAELSALKAQDTVGEVVGWYRLDRPYEMTSYPFVCATWHKLGAPVAPLYAAHAQQVSVPASAFASMAITHYEAALLAAFPSGSSGEVFNQWNEARRVLAAAPAAPAADAPPESCRQRLAAEGKPYPRSSCAACGQFSPKWRECDAAIASHRANGVV